MDPKTLRAERHRHDHRLFGSLAQQSVCNLACPTLAGLTCTQHDFQCSRSHPRWCSPKKELNRNPARSSCVETPSRSRSVVWCVLSCACGVCGVWVVCVHVVLCVVSGMCVLFCCGWCVCVVCGEAWHTLSLLFSLLPLLFPFLFLSYLYFSLFFFFFFFFLLLLRHLNVIWCKAKCTAIGSLPPPLPSLLPSLPPLLKKEGTFYYRNISGDEFSFITVLNKFQKIAAGENYSHYSFILIQKQKGCNCNDFVEDGSIFHATAAICLLN